MEHVRTLWYVGWFVPWLSLFGVDLVGFVKVYDEFDGRYVLKFFIINNYFMYRIGKMLVFWFIDVTVSF